MQRGRLLAAAAVVLVLQACSSHDEPADRNAAYVASQVADAKTSGSPAQQSVLADATVDEAEYEQQFDALRFCVQKGGGSFTEYGVSRFDGLTHEFNVSGKSLAPDELSKLREKCFGQELLYAQAVYLVTHTNVTDPKILSLTSECLRAQGVELTGKETNLEQLSASAKPLLQSSTPVFRCADTAAHTAYPKEYAHRDIQMGF